MNVALMRRISWRITYKFFIQNGQCCFFVRTINILDVFTCKCASEALILQSVNPQYHDRLFIDSWLQYKKNTTSEHVVYKHCFLFLFWSSKQCLYTTCSQLVFFLYWIQEWMNNLSSYCGLTDSRMSASEKDLPVSLT